MPSDGSRKKREQFALGNRITKIGIEMILCSFYEKNGKKCVMASSESKCCTECTRLRKRCDVKGIPVRD